MGNGSPVSSSTTIATCFNASGGGEAAWGEGAAFPAPSHAAELSKSASDLSAGCTFCAYSLASMPCGNLMRHTSTPCALNRSASRAAARSPASSAS
ncbi:MAG: hypothetical protein BWX48_00060 [Verrucomicrobia bacterium ADurb.Bin006]|nr:MAG: hypothetical protein BWX48_00060 [Verrucomicrobia bacterium ADurb.Bin006]